MLIKGALSPFNHSINRLNNKEHGMTFYQKLLEAYDKEDYKDVFPIHGTSEGSRSEKHDYFVDKLHASLKPHQIPFIKNYTELGHEDINTALWNMKLRRRTFDEVIEPEETSDLNNTAEKIVNIHHALKEFPPAPEEFHVYAGMKQPTALSNIIRNGGFVHIPAFSSASLSPNVAHNFADIDYSSNGMRHVLKIKIKKGQQAGGYIEPHSSNADEEEFLLHANQLLHITHSVNMRTKEGTRVMVHHAEILAPDDIKNIPSGYNAEIDSYRGHTAKIAPLLEKSPNDFKLSQRLHHYSTTSDQNSLIHAILANSTDDINYALQSHHIPDITDGINSKRVTMGYIKATAVKNRNLTPESVSKIMTDSRFKLDVHGNAKLLSDLASKEDISNAISKGYSSTHTTFAGMKNFDFKIHPALFYGVKK